MPDVRVRAAQAADDVALLAVDDATWDTTVSPVPAPAAGSREWFFTADRDPERFLVAELDGDVVGYVALHRPDGLPTHAHVREVDGLAVLPTAQGRGVGRALVEAAVEMARVEGARRVTLRVLAHNHPARRLYERCGFVAEGVLRGEFHLDGRDVDDALMARSTRP